MINASLIAAGTYESHHWLLPETFEIIYGGIASTLVISALIKFAGPIVKKSLAARTERIQNEIDNARNARSSAETEAQQIRSALGDISSERSRILAEADAAAAVVLSEGRARVAAEMADLKRRLLQTLQTHRVECKMNLHQTSSVLHVLHPTKSLLAR